MARALDISHLVIGQYYRKKANLKSTDSKSGAVTLIQRFGGSLNLNIHFQLEAKKKPGLADNALKMFKKLYKFEEVFKLQNLASEKRFEARLNEVGPHLEKIKLWCIERKDNVLKTSAFGNAIHYFIN